MLLLLLFLLLLLRKSILLIHFVCSAFRNRWGILRYSHTTWLFKSPHKNFPRINKQKRTTSALQGWTIRGSPQNIWRWQDRVTWRVTWSSLCLLYVRSAPTLLRGRPWRNESQEATRKFPTWPSTMILKWRQLTKNKVLARKPSTTQHSRRLQRPLKRQRGERHSESVLRTSAASTELRRRTSHRRANWRQRMSTCMRRLFKWSKSE